MDKLDLNLEYTERILVDFLREDVHKTGFKKVLLRFFDTDSFLFSMKDELLESGFSEEFRNKVHKKIKSFQYKRRMSLIAKVSKITIDRKFRCPRDWEL